MTASESAMGSGRSIDMRAAWNRASAVYQERHAIPVDAAHYGPWMPTERELRLLGDVAGRRILELGCGGGQCSIAFARQGAIAVGLDLSDEQLAFARRLARQHGVQVELHQGDAADLDRFADATFDIVFSAYALQYVEEIERCLAGVARVLVPGGLLVFSLDHPFRAVFWDEKEDEDSVVAARSYWLRGAMEWQFSGSGEWMRSFHRTVGDWVDLLHAAGLAVRRILEPEPQLTPEDRLAWQDSYTLELLHLVPHTIIFVADKR
ncbi:MAG: class I SAM-dependent methyltransferase [Caldilineales bacterium]|nr:class I SAM-dependent methyltransferase [Caldilineales bacterium]MDW8319011.1 class I SAM-dependent methyltransferase [Anaerolineae bacterium]